MLKSSQLPPPVAPACLYPQICLFEVKSASVGSDDGHQRTLFVFRLGVAVITCFHCFVMCFECEYKSIRPAGHMINKSLCSSPVTTFMSLPAQVGFPKERSPSEHVFLLLSLSLFILIKFLFVLSGQIC